MKRYQTVLINLTLAITMFLLATFHSAVVTIENPPKESDLKYEIADVFIPKKEAGINQLILEGDPFRRGYISGQVTKELLKNQEKELVQQLNEIIPVKFAQKLMFLFFMRWFNGLEEFIEREWLLEMYGVSQSAWPKMNSYADPFTRQVAYHGLHEVGQMAIDSGFDGPACTQIAVSNDRSWMVGRNFDFEAGRIFDEEKIMKWVFPDKGIPYLSVIFAGMVGAVTGINAKGVYIAVNSAGSEDFVRVGTPSTLLITKALQESETAQDAVKIIEETPTLISDIYWVVDPYGSLFQVEKTPKKVRTIKRISAHAAANHFVHEDFKNDKVNAQRRDNLTTKSRLRRAQSLADRMENNQFQDHTLAQEMVKSLRDKRGSDGQRLHLGHRSAIDALIATHSVVYDAKNSRVYVSEGPALSGGYRSYDLEESFKHKKPVELKKLRIDDDFEILDFYDLKKLIGTYKKAVDKNLSGDCFELDEEELESARDSFEVVPHYYIYWYRAFRNKCAGKPEVAKRNAK